MRMCIAAYVWVLALCVSGCNVRLHVLCLCGTKTFEAGTTTEPLHSSLITQNGWWKWQLLDRRSIKGIHLSNYIQNVRWRETCARLICKLHGLLLLLVLLPWLFQDNTYKGKRRFLPGSNRSKSFSGFVWFSLNGYFVSALWFTLVIPSVLLFWARTWFWPYEDTFFDTGRWLHDAWRFTWFKPQGNPIISATMFYLLYSRLHCSKKKKVITHYIKSHFKAAIWKI